MDQLLRFILKTDSGKLGNPDEIQPTTKSSQKFCVSQSIGSVPGLSEFWRMLESSGMSLFGPFGDIETTKPSAATLGSSFCEELKMSNHLLSSWEIEAEFAFNLNIRVDLWILVVVLLLSKIRKKP